MDYSQVRNILLIFIVFKLHYGVDTYISLSKSRHVAIGWSIIASSRSVTVQTTQSQRLKFCTFSLLLPATCFGHTFDRHEVEQMQVQNMLHMRPPIHNQSTKMYQTLIPSLGVNWATLKFTYFLINGIIFC
jgi:hypothetical protein